MPYKISMDVIEEWRPVLTRIHANALKNETTVIETDFPKETRWQIYQAFNAADKLGVEPFNKIKIRIKYHGTRYLLVYTKVTPENLTLSVHSASEVISAKPIHGISSLLALVNAVLKSKENYLSFPDLEPSLIPKAILWANGMNHEVTNENPFTIRKSA